MARAKAAPKPKPEPKKRGPKRRAPRKVGYQSIRDENGLLPAQAAFCRNIVAGMPRYRAVEKVYPTAKTPKAKERRASDVMKVQAAQDYMAMLRAKILEKFTVGEARLAQEMAVVALANPLDMLDESGRWLPFCDWPEHLARCVSSFELDAETGLPVKVRFWSKVDALDKLFRKLGLYAEDNKQHATALADALRTIDAMALPGMQHDPRVIDQPPAPPETAH